MRRRAVNNRQGARRYYGLAVRRHRRYRNKMKRIIDTENVNIIGSKIKSAREKAGLTQKQLSEKLELEAVYTCRGSISRIENGRRAVTDIEIDAISKILNVSLDYLFGRE